jgi:hypothetical protein
MRSSAALLLVAASFFRSSLAIREAYQYLDDKSTNSWDHLHFEDPYFQRTGAYYAGIMYVNFGRIFEGYQSQSALSPTVPGSEPVCKVDLLASVDSEESEDEEEKVPNRLLMSAVGWIGPPAAGSDEKNPVQAWVAGWPGNIQSTIDGTSSGKDAAASTVASVKKEVQSTNARIFSYEFDTSVYAWNKSSKSPVPDHVTELFSIDPKSVVLSYDDTYLADNEGAPMLAWNFIQNPEAKPAFDSQGNAQLAGNPWANHQYFNSTCGGRLFAGPNTEISKIYPNFNTNFGEYGYNFEVGQNSITMRGLHRVFYNTTAGQDFLAQFDKLAGDTKDSWYKGRADVSTLKDKPDAYVDVEVWFLGAFDETASTNKLIVPTNENATAEFKWEKVNDKSKTATKAPTTKNSVPVVDGDSNDEKSSSSVSKQITGALVGFSTVATAWFAML